MTKIKRKISILAWKFYNKLIKPYKVKNVNYDLKNEKCLIEVALINNKLTCTIFLESYKKNLYFCFSLYKDREPIMNSEWGKENSRSWVLTESGIYFVRVYIGFTTNNMHKNSKTIEFFTEQTKQEFNKLLLYDLEPYKCKFNDKLTFSPCIYPYSDFALISRFSSLIEKKSITDLLNQAGNGFKCFQLTSIDNWINCLITNGNLIEMKNGDGFFFSGITINNKKLIFGCDEFNRNINPKDIIDNTGSYTALSINSDEICVWNDYFNFCHLFYYHDKFNIIISNRYHLLLMIVAQFKLPCRLNVEKAKVSLSTVDLFYMRHNITHEMDVCGIKQLEAYKNIVVTRDGIQFINNNLYNDVVFAETYDEQKYCSLIQQGKEEILEDLKAVLSDDRFLHVSIDLSGGMDSRTTYAAATNLTEKAEKIVINTLNSGENDLMIATSINRIYNFPFNTLPHTAVSYPLREMDNMMRSYFIGTNYEHNMHFHYRHYENTIWLYGAGGDILMRPFYSRLYLDTDFESLNEIVDKIFSESSISVITDGDKAFNNFKHIYTEQLKNIPSASLYQKLEMQWMMMGNGYHFNTQFKHLIGNTVWSSIQSKALYRAHLLSLDKFRNIRLHFDVISALNPSLVGVPYDKIENNIAYKKQKKAIINFSNEKSKKIPLVKDYIAWEKSNKEKNNNVTYKVIGQTATEANMEIKNFPEIQYKNLIYNFILLMHRSFELKESVGIALFHYIQKNKENKKMVRFLYNKITSLLDQLNIIDSTSIELQQYFSFYAYVFSSVSESISIEVVSSNILKTHYYHNKSKKPAYIQLFDNGFEKIPSAKYAKLSNISGNKRLFFSVGIEADNEGSIDIFIMEYDDARRIGNTSKRILISKEHRRITINTYLKDESSQYKIAIKYNFDNDVQLVFSDLMLQSLE